MSDSSTFPAPRLVQTVRMQRRPARSPSGRFRQCLLTLAGLFVPWAGAYAQHDHGGQALTVFLSAADIQRSADKPPSLDSNEFEPLADVLVGLRHDRWRLLGEFLVGRDDHEFERLQFGYELSDDTVLWLGRYHQPASAWNIFFHHGQYLQPSITRPWIEEWEDEDGVMPQHIAGVLFETQVPSGNEGAWRITAGAGFAPQLQQHELIPVGVFSGRNSSNGANGGLRLEWLPDQVGEDTVGVMASRSEISVSRTDTLFAPHLDYELFGAFFSFGHERFRSIGAIYAIQLRADRAAADPSEHHIAAYLQVDYAVRPDLTIFARHENLTNASGSNYLQQFDNVQVRRSLAGLRRQLGHSNALSLELARNSGVSSNAFTETRIQWSAAIP